MVPPHWGVANEPGAKLRVERAELRSWDGLGSLV